MKKIEIIKEIAKQTAIEKHTVETVIETFMSSVKEHVINNEHVALSGFGRFTVKKRAAKMGRNIPKNIPIKVAQHFIPSFKPSKKFTRKVKKALGQA
ncbi:MAG TPA: HU family DNA-binding protein [Bacteroidia bacterium]|nr:HU family DNA-binding protein [Bacteroidia bacterium]